ncbi:MAG: hypothetical protein NTW13_01845 [Candidatus Omnitrophica bacterium]|nr:hypothetical protein [Candidatus Omnitrophota bacterium]
MRIVVPDAGRYLLAYQSGRKDDWLALGCDLTKLPKDLTQMEIINFIFRQKSEHLYAYDFEILSNMLKNVGFSKIIRYDFGVSSVSELCNDLPNHKSNSLYVEALK